MNKVFIHDFTCCHFSGYLEEYEVEYERRLMPKQFAITK